MVHARTYSIHTDVHLKEDVSRMPVIHNLLGMAMLLVT